MKYFIIGMLMSIPPYGAIFKPFGETVQIIGCIVQISGLIIMGVTFKKVLSK